MLAEATGNAAPTIEPSVIVTFVGGVLVFVAGGGLSWIFPTLRAWRRIEQRAKVLEQVHDKIGGDVKQALVKDLEAAILAQLSRPETAPTVAADDPSIGRFLLQLLGLVMLSVAIGLAGWFRAQDASSVLEQVAFIGIFGIIAVLGLYGSVREFQRRFAQSDDKSVSGGRE